MKTILLLAGIIAMYGMAVWYVLYRVSMYMVRKAAQKLAENNFEQFRQNNKEFEKFVRDLESVVNKLPSFVSFFYNPAWIKRLCEGLSGRNESIKSMIGENAGAGALAFVAGLLLIGFITIDMMVVLGFALLNKYCIFSIGLILFGVSILLICAEFLMIRNAKIIKAAEMYSAAFAVIILFVSWFVTEFVLGWKF